MCANALPFNDLTLSLSDLDKRKEYHVIYYIKRGCIDSRVRADNDDYSQISDLFRIFDSTQQQRLFQATAGSMGGARRNYQVKIRRSITSTAESASEHFVYQTSPDTGAFRTI